MKTSDFNEKFQRQIRDQLCRSVRPVQNSEPQQLGQHEVSRQVKVKAGHKKRVVVSLVSLRRRLVDDDNLVGGFKHLRDAIAESLGIDDGDKSIKFEYAQMITSGIEGVMVKIQTEALPESEPIIPASELATRWADAMHAIAKADLHNDQP